MAASVKYMDGDFANDAIRQFASLVLAAYSLSKFRLWKIVDKIYDAIFQPSAG